MDDALRQSYTSTGTLRVALNFGNRVLVGRDAEGRPAGISVDLAHELAGTIGCDLTWVEFDRAIDVSNAVEQGLWDVCFLAVDPKRAETIAFTAPYVRISGCYLVAAGVDVATGAQVPERALRIGVVEGSAYTLHLGRQQGADHLVEMPDIVAALAALDVGDVDGIAGIEQAMAQEAQLRPGSRVLQPPFMEIRQAMGVPAGRPAAAAHLRHHLASLANGGTVGTILERHGVSAGCAVIPD